MSIHEFKCPNKQKVLSTTMNKTEDFKFKSYIDKTNLSRTLNHSNGFNSFNGKSSIGKNLDSSRSSKFKSENLLSFSKSARTGRIQKAKKNTNLECFNLLEKEKFRQLIEQNQNFRPKTTSQSLNQKNVYKHFIHASPTITRDDNNTKETEKLPILPTNPAQARVSAGYSRRISLSLDSKPESMLKSNVQTYFNKYASSSNGVLKNSSNSLFNGAKYSSNGILNSTKSYNNNNNNKDATIIDLIDISNTPTILNVTKPKAAQKRPNQMNWTNENDDRNSLDKFRKEKKDFYSLYTNGNGQSILNRSLNEFEKSIDNRLKNNNTIIEAVLKKSQSKLDANLFIEEERYKMKKRQRQEKDLIERELAQKFTQQLHVDSNKYDEKCLIFEEEPIIENEFPELEEEHNMQIDSALVNSPQDEVLANKFNISICRKDVQTLRGLNWLNDEIINFYMSLICERGKDESNSYLKVHAFTTFFYPKLIKDGFMSLRRWTRKVDIFSFDMIIIPLHLGLHWTLAVIDFDCREIRYYDSMNGNNGECLKALRNYLVEEHKDKKGAPYDLSDWNFLHNKNLPQQMNGSDCGMFACKYAEYLSRAKTNFNFNQSHMPYFRRRMIWEILNTKLM